VDTDHDVAISASAAAGARSGSEKPQRYELSNLAVLARQGTLRNVRVGIVSLYICFPDGKKAKTRQGERTIRVVSGLLCTAERWSQRIRVI
jgi:hypothetical protein